MKLDRLLEALRERGQLVEVIGTPPEVFEKVEYDSRSVSSGSLFVAVEGTSVDGHDFLDDALTAGAATVMVSHRCAIDLPQIVVRDPRIGAALSARELYQAPVDDMCLVGITGTNGKSTTTAYLRHLMNVDGTAGAIGTLGTVDGDGLFLPDSSKLTTPDPLSLHKSLGELYNRGVRTVAMEVSSHSLDQKRVAGIGFRAGVYTNIAHEHLDYHRDLADYLDAKLSLSNYIDEGGVEVVNADVPTWSALPSRGFRRVSYGTAANTDVCAVDIDLRVDGTSFTLVIDGSAQRVDCGFIGEFNVSNALAAAAAAWSLGNSPEAIAARLHTVPIIPGRMEILYSGRWIVLRDYAHTPDAYRRVLGTLRDATPGRLLILFGCGGDRDRKKRPEMGRTAGQLSDLVILTTDNPRTEDTEQIFQDVEQGLEGIAHLRIDDRAEAITRAVHMLDEGDTLLLAGKGHEDYQLIGAKRIPFDEVAVVNKALASRAAS